MIRVSIRGVVGAPETVTLPGLPAEGHVIRFGRFTYIVDAIEWVPNADHVNIYVKR